MTAARSALRLGLIALVIVAVSLGRSSGRQRRPDAYPAAFRSSDAETLGTERIGDPYRWLESVDSPQAREWVASEEALLRDFTGADPYRAAVYARLEALQRYDVYGLPSKAGQRVFYTKSSAGGSRTVLWMEEGMKTPRAILDMEADLGSDARLRGFAPSRDGQRIALLIRRQQSNWIEARVFDVDRALLLPDQLLHIYAFAGPVAWEPDGRGFYYTAFDAPPDARSLSNARNARVMRHRLGAPQREDVAVTGVPRHDGWLYTQTISDDGRWLIVNAKPGSAQHDEIYVGRANSEPPTVTRLVPGVKAAFTYLGALKDRLYFYTDFEAERGRVVAIGVDAPEPAKWTSVVPQGPHAISARDQTGGNALGMFGDRVVLTYLRDGQPYIGVYAADGTHVRNVELPTAGSIWGGFSGRQSDPVVFYSFMGLTEPGTPYRLHLDEGEPSVFKASPIEGFDRQAIAVQQVFVTSRDGTRVPMFVAHKRGIPLDGQRRTWMYGYGAMGWVSFLYFQPQILVWLEQGGVYAQPSLRGGGEYGNSWHRAGSGRQEQNSIDDFIASAQWLIDRGYTSPRSLVAHGGSLSGALAGAAINQRPELFGAALIDRPVLDLLRYDKFTGGAYWAAELGSPSDPASRAVLKAVSPYHNVKTGTCYPATLVMSGDLDQTAVPAHAYKYVAALQHAQACDRPVLLKVMRGAGHNFGTSPASIADSYADALAFLNATLDRPPRSSRSH